MKTPTTCTCLTRPTDGSFCCAKAELEALRAVTDEVIAALPTKAETASTIALADGLGDVLDHARDRLLSVRPRARVA